MNTWVGKSTSAFAIKPNTRGARRYLLDDVPQVSGRLQLQHAVLDSDSVKLGAFFVAQERVRDPDLAPRAGAEVHFDDFAAERREGEARIAPCLTQVHAHLVVLQQQQQQHFKF